MSVREILIEVGMSPQHIRLFVGLEISKGLRELLSDLMSSRLYLLIPFWRTETQMDRQKIIRRKVGSTKNQIKKGQQAYNCNKLC